MECIEARALKAGFLSQMATKTQVYCNDDVWGFTGINASAEEFHIEDLLNLDFSDDGGFSEEDKGGSRYGCQKNSFSAFFGADEFDTLSAGEFTDPVEGLESLEWLSQFVEDSSAELSLLCPTRSFTVGDSVNNPPMKAQATFVDVEVPRKRRSKRPLSNALPWALVPPPLNSVDSSSTSSSSHGSSSFPVFVFPHPAPDLDWLSSAEKSSSPPPEKKPKRNPENQSSMRRCTHCLVQKTPQWRTGPLGPKTLCNACGVRFKSSRLFPEYRPACSPTFSQEVHSNSHRKVLEMRRRKEMATTTTAIDEHSGFVSPVVSIGVSD